MLFLFAYRIYTLFSCKHHIYISVSCFSFNIFFVFYFLLVSWFWDNEKKEKKSRKRIKLLTNRTIERKKEEERIMYRRIKWILALVVRNLCVPLSVCVKCCAAAKTKTLSAKQISNMVMVIKAKFARDLACLVALNWCMCDIGWKTNISVLPTTEINKYFFVVVEKNEKEKKKQKLKTTREEIAWCGWIYIYIIFYCPAKQVAKAIRFIKG